MVSGSLIVKFKVTDEVAFNSIKIEFDFRNPITALDCSVLPVFTLSILDFKLYAEKTFEVRVSNSINGQFAIAYQK